MIESCFEPPLFVFQVNAESTDTLDFSDIIIYFNSPGMVGFSLWGIKTSVQTETAE